MYETRTMNGREPEQDLLADHTDARERQSPFALEERTERDPGDPLHGEIGQPVGVCTVLDEPDHVAVTNALHDLCFGREARMHCEVARKCLVQDLHGDWTQAVLGLEYAAHASATEQCSEGDHEGTD
jgi:hypothetical protein